VGTNDLGVTPPRKGKKVSQRTPYFIHQKKPSLGESRSGGEARKYTTENAVSIMNQSTHMQRGTYSDEGIVLTEGTWRKKNRKTVERNHSKGLSKKVILWSFSIKEIFFRRVRPPLLGRSSTAQKRKKGRPKIDTRVKGGRGKKSFSRSFPPKGGGNNAVWCSGVSSMFRARYGISRKKKTRRRRDPRTPQGTKLHHKHCQLIPGEISRLTQGGGTSRRKKEKGSFYGEDLAFLGANRRSGKNDRTHELQKLVEASFKRGILKPPPNCLLRTSK